MYYPKSEITPNLSTNGTEFVYVSTGKLYKGPYYATSDGKFYTGAEYSPNAQEIIKSSIKSVSKSSTPINFIPQPSSTDYNNGFFIRYVIKRVNSGIETIKEINETDYYTIIRNPLYNATQFKWKLTGPLYDDLSNPNMPVYGIIDTNERTLQQQEYIIPGISKFFVNLAQYSK
jgi:hypothetical protein